MISHEDVLTDNIVRAEYEKIDKQNNYPFNHGMKHVENTIAIMKDITDKLDIEHETREALLIACILHDIGQTDGRDRHGEKGRRFAEKYLESKCEEPMLGQILDAIEQHDTRDMEGLMRIPLFSHFVCFADKMDFSKKRLEENYQERFGWVEYEDIEFIDIQFKRQLIVRMVSSVELKSDLIMERPFFKMVVDVTKTLARKMNYNYCFMANEIELDI